MLLLGENEVAVRLFFFFSLSSSDVNSSSELADASNLDGAERVRLGEASNVGVLGGGIKKGDNKESEGVLASLSHKAALFLLVFDGWLGFERRVLQVLLTTMLSSSSSLSLMKTGESHWDNGFLNACWAAAGVLLFLGTAKQRNQNIAFVNI